MDTTLTLTTFTRIYQRGGGLFDRAGRVQTHVAHAKTPLPGYLLGMVVLAPVATRVRFCIKASVLGASMTLIAQHMSTQHMSFQHGIRAVSLKSLEELVPQNGGIVAGVTMII